MRWILHFLGLVLTVLRSPALYGQLQGGTHGLGLYGEPPLPGWIPGQGTWPALGPSSPAKHQGGVGLRFHPYLPGLGLIHLAYALQTQRDWLTVGLQRNGWWAYSTNSLRLGLSRRYGQHRIGLNMSMEWNQHAQFMDWAYGLGTEHRLNSRLYSGFRIQHLGMQSGTDPSRITLWQTGLHMTMEQEALSGGLRLHLQEGGILCSEWVLRYQPSLTYQFWFVGDPINGLFSIGLGYRIDKVGLSLSPLRSQIPGTFYRSTVSYP